MKWKLINEILKCTFSTLLFVCLMYFYPIERFRESLLYAIVTNMFGSITSYLFLRKYVNFFKINELDSTEGRTKQTIYWVVNAFGIYLGVTLFIFANSESFGWFVLYYIAYRIMVELLFVRYLNSQIKTTKLVLALFLTIIGLLCIFDF